VPAVKAGAVEVVGKRDGGGVEGFVVRVAELDAFEAFIRRNEAVAYDLDLGLVGDGSEIRMEDGPLGVEGLAVTV